jgi:hypothetical protein
MADWHRPRIRALVEAGVDILAFETVPAQSEAEVLLGLLKEFPEQKAWLSFSCKVCIVFFICDIPLCCNSIIYKICFSQNRTTFRQEGLCV